MPDSTLWYSHTDNHRGQLISDIISNSEHIILNTDSTHQNTAHHTTAGQLTRHHNILHYTIQPHNMVHNTRTKLISPSHNHNNQDTHQIQTTTKHTHSPTIGKQTGHSSLQTPRLLSRTFNHHQTYTPSSQTSFSTQINTTSQKARYTPHGNYSHNT